MDFESSYKIPKEKKKKMKDKDVVESTLQTIYHSASDGENYPSSFVKKDKKSKKKDKISHMNYIKEEHKSPGSHKKKKNDKDLSPMKFGKSEEDIVSSTTMTTDRISLSPKKKVVLEDGSKKKKKRKHSEIMDQANHEDSDEEKEVGLYPDKGSEATQANSEDTMLGQFGILKEDFMTLIDNIEKWIPPNDTHKYNSTVKKLDWEKIKFNNFTAQECKDMWNKIQHKMRKYRLLKEITADARQLMEKPWYNFYGSIKNNRHPDMPKRPLSNYMLFYLEKKDKYFKKHPTVGLGGLSKIIGSKFQQLSPSKKAKYDERAKQLRMEYEEKMEKFRENHPNSVVGVKSKSSKDKNEMPGPPKPSPPIKLFIEEKLKNYAGNQDMSKNEIITEIKELWKHLSNKKKVPWLRWAKESEKKYLEELEVYKSENPNFEMPKHKSLLTKEEIAILERMEGKPVKPPNSAYSLFSQIMLKDKQLQLVNFSPKEKMKEIARLWGEVSNEEKKQYAEKAKNLNNTYKLDYATYLESLPEEKRKEELEKTVGRQKRKRKEEPGQNESSKEKKLKQTKLLDSFVKKKEEVIKEQFEDSDNGNESDDESEGETDSDSIFNHPEKVIDIKKKINELEPPKPCEHPFNLFKQIYLTNPVHKESKAQSVWESMPPKEKNRYKKKLDAQKQNYMIKYNEFLKKLKPEELKVFSSMKSQREVNDESSGETSDDEADSDSSDDSSDEEDAPVPKPEKKIKSNTKPAESSDSSSEDSSD